MRAAFLLYLCARAHVCTHSRTRHSSCGLFRTENWELQEGNRLYTTTRTVTHTLVSWGELRMCTVLGLTPLALALRYKAKRLFLRPRSPLGREPLYLKADRQKQRRKKNKSEGDNSDFSGVTLYFYHACGSYGTDTLPPVESGSMSFHWLQPRWREAEQLEPKKVKRSAAFYSYVITTSSLLFWL